MVSMKVIEALNEGWEEGARNHRTRHGFELVGTQRPSLSFWEGTQVLESTLGGAHKAERPPWATKWWAVGVQNWNLYLFSHFSHLFYAISS